MVVAAAWGEEICPVPSWTRVQIFDFRLKGKSLTTECTEEHRVKAKDHNYNWFQKLIFRRNKDFPQGLKPASLLARDGMAKAMPFQRNYS
jgi:hypothetical protein